MSKLAKAAFIVLIMNLISRVLGFVRDAVIAKQFGASGATDAYLVAYTLPYSLQAILGVAFATLVVPVVTGYLLRKEEEQGWKVVSSMLNGTTLLLTILTILGMIFAPFLVRIMAPGFSGQTVELTAHLSRIMFPSIIFMGTGMLLTGVLNAGKQFTIPAFAPALANIIVILAVLVFGAEYRVEGLAYGTLAGFVGFFLIQIPNLRKINFRYHWVMNFQDPGVRSMIFAIVPMSLSISINQILLALNRFFASHLTAGSITALDFANRLMNLPLGIFAAAVSTAIFPAMAEGVAKKDFAALAQTVRKGLGMVTVAIVPAAIGLIVLKEPIVRLVFERGAFDARATVLTSTSLLYFSLGLWFIAVNTILTRAFYAMQDLKSPLLLGLVSVVADIVLSIILLPKMGHNGLALANSLAAVLNMFQLYWSLQLKVKGIGSKGLVKTTVVTFGASLAMGAVAVALYSGLGNWFGISQLGNLINLTITCTCSALLYVLLVLAFKIDEIQAFLAILKRKNKIAN
ncbi:murein biosynthesis integral membrane protein MurJ [Bacillota bacterium LX-D]|nr:murein biosynthesis integral membrane protein MurJ [Bacillota bacterium LX-D]